MRLGGRGETLGRTTGASGGVILVFMPLPVAEVQRALADEGLDGWLLYDFQGSNPIAARLSGLAAGKKMTTRRWYYLIPATGEPRGLVHAIERHNLDGLPGDKKPYAGRDRLKDGLRGLLMGLKKVAMEYSPGNNIPYISRVDAGTIESVRDLGVEVVSSGDLVQRFEALWSAEALASHQTASDAEGLTSSDTPNVSAQENAGNPHYHPSREAHRSIRPNEVLLLDLWGKLRDPGAVFADITWVGFTGSTVPEQYARAFAAARDGRDAAVDLVQSAARGGRELRGFEVDRTCRAVVEKAGYGAEFIHRTGHSLGETVHGNGVHLDDYETHDDRRVIPGTGFTIEPGVYTSSFGVRTEINMFMAEGDAYVSGPRQEAILPLG
jgi:hypothetical protein